MTDDERAIRLVTRSTWTVERWVLIAIVFALLIERIADWMTP